MSDDPEMSVTDMQLETDQLYKDIYHAMNLACPVRKVPIRVPQVKWWNTEIDELKKRAKRIANTLRWMKKFPNRTPKKRYTEKDKEEALKEYDKKSKKAGRKNWKDFISGTDSFHKAASLSRIMVKRARNNIITVMHNPEGKELGPVETAEYMSETFFPGCTDDHREAAYDYTKKCNIKDERADFINDTVLKEAIRKFKPFKGPGTDGIPPIVLKHFGPLFRARLLKVYKASTLLSALPTQWLEMRIVFVAKPNKSDYSTPRAHRPLALTQYLKKGLERIKLWKHERTTLSETPLHPNQHGFRKMMGADTNLDHLNEEIFKAFQKDLQLMAIQMDIKGAYDHVKNDDVVESLTERGGDPLYIGWNKFFLENRKLLIEVRGVKLVRYATKGTPQGSICSPTHWNELYDSYLRMFDDPQDPVKALGYADDTIIFVVGTTLKQ